MFNQKEPPKTLEEYFICEMKQKDIKIERLTNNREKMSRLVNFLMEMFLSRVYPIEEYEGRINNEVVQSDSEYQDLPLNSKINEDSKVFESYLDMEVCSVMNKYGLDTKTLMKAISDFEKRNL